MRRTGGVLLAVAAGLVVVRLWIMPLPSSLWLDEFGTVWVTGGGLSGVVERSRLFPQSIPYAGLVAIVRGAFGSSEIALRAPSILAMLAALALVARLGRACFGVEAGPLAAGVFLLFPAIEFAAADARPYAFGVLAAAAALLLLKRWLDAGRLRDATGYVLAAALAVYFQYLFAAALVGHAVYAVFRIRRGTPVPARGSVAAAAALAVLLAPAAFLGREIGAQRHAHEFGALPDALGLLNALVPMRVLGVLIPAILFVVALRGARGVHASESSSHAADGRALLLSAALAPPLTLFAASRVFATPVFEARYLLETAPAWAALLGGALERLEPAGAGRISLAGALALALVLRGEPGRLRVSHGREDWRDALAAAERAAPGAPVLLSGSFAEARDPGLAAAPRHQDYLTEPVRYYAPHAAASALPIGSAPGADALAGRLISTALSGPRFVLVERSSRSPSRVEAIDGMAFPQGLTGREIWRSGPLRVRVYERPGAAS